MTFRPLPKAPEKYEREQIQKAFSDLERYLITIQDKVEDVVILDGRRFILLSPGGNFWEVTIDNAGVLQTTDLGTSII